MNVNSAKTLQPRVYGGSLQPDSTHSGIRLHVLAIFISTYVCHTVMLNE